VTTNFTPDTQWDCTWPTMQEVLQDAGVSWKVYSPSNAGVRGKYAGLANYGTWAPSMYDPITNPEVMLVSDHVLPYFTAFRDQSSPLYAKAFNQTFPNDFVADVKSGTLPKVSWMIPPIGFDEHPSASPDNGAYFISMVLDALVANPEVWAKTVMVLMYDENDGWFDHVPPPVPPRHTAGEYLTTSTFPASEPLPETQGIQGPLGLGVRVPAVIISPFSRGGHVATEVFDHTSQLKLISERWGVPIPNVSKWRRETVGDLTSAMFQSAPDLKLPKLPTPTPVLTTTGPCAPQTMGSDGGGAAAKFPTKQRMPNQRGGTESASRYFAETDESRAISDDAETEFMEAGRTPVTTKSKANALAKV
jgi:phospholipase C